MAGSPLPPALFPAVFFFQRSVGQVNTDGQGVVHALDMLIRQPSNVFCQPLLVEGPHLFHQNDGGPLKAALSVDKVVGGQLWLYPCLRASSAAE